MSSLVCPLCGRPGERIVTGGREAGYCDPCDAAWFLDEDSRRAPTPDHPIDSADRRDRQEVLDE